jgi:hypothetical protein
MTDTDVAPRQTSPADGDPTLVDEQLADELLAVRGPRARSSSAQTGCCRR